MAVLGLVDRGQAVEVGTREQAGDVAADRGAVIARHVGEGVARGLVMPGEVASDGEHVARRGCKPAVRVSLEGAACGGDHAAWFAGRGRDQKRPVVLELREARKGRVVDRPALRLLAGGAPRPRLVGAGEEVVRLAGTAVYAMRVDEVEGGVVQVVGLEGALAGGHGLLAERGGALGPEPADGACDLGRVARAWLALEERPVMDQRLPLLAREPAVVPEVHGGGGGAVGGAAGQEKGGQHGPGRRAREDGEPADEGGC